MLKEHNEFLVSVLYGVLLGRAPHMDIPKLLFVHVILRVYEDGAAKFQDALSPLELFLE